jgi:predicted alpha/beta-hydrolase family hydrolase
VRIYLAPGASGTVQSMRPWLTALRTHGLDARAVTLPRGSAERAIPAWLAAIDKVDLSGTIIGGQSFGGRVASMIAADTPPAGLVLLSYPLHRPGRREQLRIDHWPRIGCPTLLLSGESDPFATIGLLRESVGQLPNAELVTYPGVGHGLTRVIDDAVGRIVSFAARLASAAGASAE